MHVAVRSSLTAGVALVGAGAIALSPVSPVTPALPEAFTPTTHSTAFNLTAVETNPVAAWSQLATNLFISTSSVAGAVVADPAPVIRQVIANQTGNVVAITTGLVSTIESLVNSIGSSDPGTIGGIAAQIRADLLAGDFSAAGAHASDLVINALFSAFGLITALEIPITMAQNFGKAVEAAIGFNGLVGAVLGVVSTVQGTLRATGDSVQAVADAVGDGDLAGIVGAVASMPATVTDAVLNGYAYEFVPGFDTESAGLLTYKPDQGIVGLVPALLVKLPRAIADAITPAPAASLAKVAPAKAPVANTVTLDVAPQSAPAAEENAEGGTESGGSGDATGAAGSASDDDAGASGTGGATGSRHGVTVKPGRGLRAAAPSSSRAESSSDTGSSASSKVKKNVTKKLGKRSQAKSAAGSGSDKSGD